MLALSLNVFFTVSFGHIMKLASRRKVHLLWMLAVNYLCASAICLIVTALAPPARHITFTVLTGAWGGVCYMLALVFYFSAVGRLGMGLSTSAIRLSVALPVAAALLIWHETLHPTQAVGLLLVAVALPLLGSGNYGSLRGGLALAFGLVLPLFLINGLGQLANRIFSGGAPSANTFLFLSALFASAALVSLITLAFRWARPRRQDVLLGLLLGTLNLLTNIFLLVALRQLPSAVVFPVSSAGSVLFANLTGMLIWGERLPRLAIVGVLVTTVAVVLIAR